jgi:peptide/nickel transport system ATP-binding protein
MARSILGLLPRSAGRRPTLRPSAGRILFRGEDLLAATPARLRQIRGGGIGMIFQEPMTALNPLMTIGRQIDEVIATHRRLPRRERLQRAIAMFADVRLPHPAAIVHAYPHELSGGERQRAMIAMALVLEPDILIADEPTTALDVTTQAQILALIRELRQGRGTGIIFITHDFGVVAEIADRVAVMEKGQLVEIGRARQVLDAPHHPYTRALIDAVPGLVPPPRRGVPDQTLIELRDLDKLYRSRAGLFRAARGAVHAVKHANLVVRRGETLGLVGESGSGKSTLARCIVRLVDAEHGQILFDGTDLRALSRRAMRPHRARLQMVFQDPFASLNPRSRVRDLIAAGPLLNGASREQAYAHAAELLGLVGLDPGAAMRFPHEFSGGQRQRIGIARALALRPDVLIADEPVSALDVSIQRQILELLVEIRERMHLTMLFITHDLRVAAQLCDSIAVMRRGEIVEYGAADLVLTRPQSDYTRALVAAVPGKAWDLARAAADRPAIHMQ